MAFVVIGVILLVVCVILLLVRRSQQARLSEIMGTETNTVRQLSDSAKYVSERMGEAGNFNQIAEVKGVVRCDAPLTSEVASQPCVYYTMNVSREYDETYWETDPQSKQQVSKTRRGSETVASNTQRIPFFLEDATGQILVDPTGADVDAAKVVDRFEHDGNSLNLGGLRIDLGGMLSMGSGRRTIGYKVTESLIPLDRGIYVLGEAVDSTGKVSIQKPREKGRKFLISVKSEEELIRSTGSTIQWLLISAAGSGVVGAALIVLGLIKM